MEKVTKEVVVAECEELSYHFPGRYKGNRKKKIILDT